MDATPRYMLWMHPALSRWEVSSEMFGTYTNASKIRLVFSVKDVVRVRAKSVVCEPDTITKAIDRERVLGFAPAGRKWPSTLTLSPYSFFILTSPVVDGWLRRCLWEIVLRAFQYPARSSAQVAGGSSRAFGKRIQCDLDPCNSKCNPPHAKDPPDGTIHERL